ncbi:hypothetical protein [Paramicrobacterium chengjingii]|uniref:Uncharacterized protein n=1 Tax=Paramicrobacterium chengjingii TaxID=2769067 RepID=A0ABX6YGF1_9MICO|nr:hypothetical protein [Microbacterium chengjingii]QPZ37470.1 hypothetical protein HCR76_11560 [Microbacterium chengjingii]
MTEINEGTNRGLSRRTMVKGAAWSVPVIAVAAATPAAAASEDTVVNGFQVAGTCGLLGTLGAGFTVAAGDTEIPAGTQITIVTDATIANVNVVSLSGQGLANVDLLSEDTVAITLTEAIPANGQMNVQWLLSIGLLTDTTATLTLPAGYTAGTGTKPQGTLSQTAIICNAS